MADTLKNKLFYPAATQLKAASGSKQSTFKFFPMTIDGELRHKMQIDLLLEVQSIIKNFTDMGGDDDVILKKGGWVFVEKQLPADQGTDVNEGSITITKKAADKVTVNIQFELSGGGKTQNAS